MRAITQDREAAILQGINAEAVSTIGFAIGCSLAAAAGALMGIILPIGPFMGQGPLIKALTIIVLGGMGSIPGAALGGLILGQIESSVTFYWSFLGAELVFFLIIILVLFIRPRGLLGAA
jgi:branched-chain amino acid transport system permease protein